MDKTIIPKESTAIEPNSRVLRPSTIEKVFTDCVMDLKQVLVLDGIDIQQDVFQVYSHDLHGPLPDITVKNSGDTFQDKERLANEACKMLSIVNLRGKMIRFLPGCNLLPPTFMDGMAVVGLQARPMTWLAEGKDFLEAYHDLYLQVVG